MTRSYSKDAQLRYDQAMVDADIEGMTDDPAYIALVKEMDKQGLRADLRIKRIKELALKLQTTPTAAE